MEKIRNILEKTDVNFSVEDDLSPYGLDSINTVRLIVELEDMFDIIFEDDELLFQNFSTVNHIVSRIIRKLPVSSE